MEGGSWTSNLSWVKGYDNVLAPMEQASVRFHELFDLRQQPVGRSPGF